MKQYFIMKHDPENFNRVMRISTPNTDYRVIEKRANYILDPWAEIGNSEEDEDLMNAEVGKWIERKRN